MKDQYGRTIDYMRISVTDRCNLRCEFCIPNGAVCFKKVNELLHFDECKKIVKAAVNLGIHKFRITGGEPLVREGTVSFIHELKRMEGVNKVYLTTNGVLLEENLDGLLKAGIDGINVSLCSTDRDEYKKITGMDRLELVIHGIAKAVEFGIHTKINTVPVKNRNEQHLLEIAALAKDSPLEVRFIEMMPIGRGAFYEMISNKKILNKLELQFGKSLPAEHIDGNGPAVYRKFPGFIGNIGFISARTCEFCSACNRIRLSADGYLKLCLNYEDGVDLKPLLRSGREIEEITELMQETIYHKPAHHSFNDNFNQRQELHMSIKLNTKYMAQIGG